MPDCEVLSPDEIIIFKSPPGLLLQAGQVMKVTIKNPILVLVLKAIQRRWLREKLLLRVQSSFNP